MVLVTSEGVSERKRNLTSKEVDVLKLLYRFRFATNEHLAAAQGVHPHSAGLRAARMVKMGYTVQLREGRDVIEGRPGAYVLTSKGASYLKKLNPDKYSDRVLRTIVTSKTASKDFIERNLVVFSVFNRLNATYGDDLMFLTKSGMEADKFDFLPEIKPDAFLQVGEAYYFLYYLNKSSPDYTHVRRFNPLFDYGASGIWENVTQSPLPTVLFVAETKRLETFARKRFDGLAIKVGSDFECATATLANVLQPNDDAVWSHNDLLFSLRDLINK